MNPRTVIIRCRFAIATADAFRLSHGRSNNNGTELSDFAVGGGRAPGFYAFDSCLDDYYYYYYYYYYSYDYYYCKSKSKSKSKSSSNSNRNSKSKIKSV